MVIAAFCGGLIQSATDSVLSVTQDIANSQIPEVASRPVILPSRSFILLAFLGSLAACGAKQTAKPVAETGIAVSVAIARPADGGSRILASGMLERERSMTLSFRIPGVLRRLSVDAGDSVQAGQVIAEIDATQVDARMAQAQADLAKATRDLARDKPLAAQGWISPARLADRETAVTLAQAATKNAGFDKRWAALRAPATGVVLHRHAQAGEVVQPGTPIITMADEHSGMVLRASLSDKERVKVRLGQAAQVQFGALGNAAVSGAVTRLDAAADARTGAFVAEIRVPNDPRLKTGFIGEAMLDVSGGDSASNSVRVPAEALFEVKQGQGFVYSLGPDRKTAHKLQVRFLGFDGDDALVAGLGVGSTVITAGGAFVTDGTRVTVAGQQ
jgi:RND family efflux transporter MFP subunit